jgi:hypothetical protein
MKLPGNNTITLCPASLIGIVQEALNARTYSSDKLPYRVLAVEARTEGATTVFHFTVTTDGQQGGEQ